MLLEPPKVLVLVLVAEQKRQGRRAGNQGLAGPRQESLVDAGVDQRSEQRPRARAV